VTASTKETEKLSEPDEAEKVKCKEYWKRSELKRSVEGANAREHEKPDESATTGESTKSTELPRID
jgi:hypothetical protein